MLNEAYMNFAIITAVTPDYLKKLRWTLPTWSIKPQFKNKKLYIYFNGFKDHTDLLFAEEYFNNVYYISWSAPKSETKREEILSSFVYAAKDIKEEYYVKIDADAFFVDSKDVFDESDFEYDLVSHKWGYTKPAWWIKELDNFYYSKNDEYEKETGSIGHKRIQSICCLHKTEFVREILSMVGDRLPVPSHDTLVWYLADKMEHRKWKSKNLRRLGVSHCSRFRSIREEICSNPESCGNPYLDDVLLDHVQIELTSYCNLKCFNCDRNCGLIQFDKDNDSITPAQYWKFISESIENGKRWNRIDLIGGEPTYHPKLDTIVEMTKIYKDWNPSTRVRFSTNGLGKDVCTTLDRIPGWISVRNSSKESRSNKFEAYNSAPVDAGETKIKACSIPWRCGIALTQNGFFLCGAGASLAKVFGIDIGIMSFKDLSSAKLREQIKVLCKYCGHSNCKSKHLTNQKELSPIWSKAIENYKSNKLRRF